ncbi:MAG: hypothetical protein LBV43_06355 [Prevotella sp.]|jgi:uncharacterized protein (TIGR02145 family)|nr:hypothetical protein [Prevotella sp.]
MRHHYLTCIFLIVFSILFSKNTIAQITVGSNVPPVDGALLDLKQASSTTKGLGLPRVILKSLTISAGNNNDLKTTIDGATGEAWDKDAHIGLVVYNIADASDCPATLPGPYVWDGDQWELLILGDTGNGGNVKPDGTVTAPDGNVYPYKKIGNYTWMTQNLRSLHINGDPSKNTLYASGHQPKINPAGIGGYPTISILVTGNAITGKAYIPDGEITYGENGETITLSNKEFVEKFGIMYNKAMAVNACPTGWHLSKEQEWLDLIRTVDNNPAAEFGDGKNQAAKKLKANNHKYIANHPTTPQPALPWGGCDTKKSVFNLLPIGQCNNAGSKGNYFSQSVLYTLADDNPTTGNAYFLRIDYDRAYVYKINEPANYTPVRCVMD